MGADFYANALSAALIALIVAAAALVWFWAGGAARARRLCLGAGLVSLAIAVIAAISHLVGGHGLNAAEPLSIAPYSRAHPAVFGFGGAALLIVIIVYIQGLRDDQ